MTVIRNRETQTGRNQSLRSLEEDDRVKFTYERSEGNLSEYEGQVTRVCVGEYSDTHPTVYVDGEYKLWYDEVRRVDGGTHVGKLYEVERKGSGE